MILINLKKRSFIVDKVLGRCDLADLFTKYVDGSTLLSLKPAIMGRDPAPVNPPGGVEPKEGFVCLMD